MIEDGERKQVEVSDLLKLREKTSKIGYDGIPSLERRQCRVSHDLTILTLDVRVFLAHN